MQHCSHRACPCDAWSGCLQLPSTGWRLNFCGQCKRVSGGLNKGNKIHGLRAAAPAEGRLRALLWSWGMRGHFSLADKQAEPACSWAGLGTRCTGQSFWQMHFVEVSVPFLMHLYLPWQRGPVQLFTPHVQGTGRTEGAGVRGLQPRSSSC